MFKDLWHRHHEFRFFIIPSIGLFLYFVACALIVVSNRQSPRLYEVECWRGKEYTFHSVDITWYHRTTSGTVHMQDVYGTQYSVVDSCSFKEARKEK